MNCAQVYEQRFETMGEAVQMMRRLMASYRGVYLMRVFLRDTLVAWGTTESARVCMAQNEDVMVIRRAILG